jgi:hypothetical protein
MVDLEQNFTEFQEKQRESPELSNDMTIEDNVKEYSKQLIHDNILSNETDEICFPSENEEIIFGLSETNKNVEAEADEIHNQMSERALKMVGEYLDSVDETNSETNDYKEDDQNEDMVVIRKCNCILSMIYQYQSNQL